MRERTGKDVGCMIDDVELYSSPQFSAPQVVALTTYILNLLIIPVSWPQT